MHVRMLVEATLHFERPDPLARDLHQLVRSTPEVVVPVPLDESIAGVDPVIAHRFARLLRLAPVARRGAVSPHEQHAFLAGSNRVTLGRRQLHLVARHAGAGGTEPVIVQPIRQVDMQHLGRPQPLRWAMSRKGPPARIRLLGKHLRRRHRLAQRAEIPIPNARDSAKCRVQRRQSEEDRRTEAFDRVQHRTRFRPPGQEHGGGPHRKREREGIAESVGEEDLRHREAAIVHPEPQHVRAEGLMRVRHVVVKVDDALGPPGRARRRSSATRPARPLRIRFAVGLVHDLDALRSGERRLVLDGIQLRHEPTRPTKHVKRLRKLLPPFEHVPPIWQLRIGEHRVFYDVDEVEKVVSVRAVRRKPPHMTTERIL